MITFVYAIHDKRIQRFNKPVVKEESPDQVHDIARAGYLQSKPEDRIVGLDVYCLGSFDTKTGRFDILEDKQLVASNAVFEEECKDVQSA